MKTEFTREHFLVLTDDDSRVISIIKCDAGSNNITEKVVQSLREDYDAESVELKTTPETVMYDYNYEFDFTATINANEEVFEENFTLTFTAVY